MKYILIYYSITSLTCLKRKFIKKDKAKSVVRIISKISYIYILHTIRLERFNSILYYSSIVVVQYSSSIV